MERICINCAHKCQFVSEIEGKKYYRCKKNADVIHDGVLQIVSNIGECEDNFKPSQAYLEQLEEFYAECANESPSCENYGLTPGIDFPATL